MIGWIILATVVIIAAILRYFIFPPQDQRKQPVKSRTAASPPTPPSREPALPFLPAQFVVFDLETTGLNPKRHEIIEIGAIRVTTASSHHVTLRTLVKPLKPIPKRITRITGISQAMVESDGVALEEAIREFIDFIGDLPLVSYNAQFDMSFLEQSTARYNLTIRNPATCALKMARRAWPGRESYRLVDLARDGRLSCDDAHHALGDCKRTMIVYAAAAAELQAASDGVSGSSAAVRGRASSRFAAIK